MWFVRFRSWLLGGVYTVGAAAVMVREDDAVLLVKPWYRRGWGLPGGTMERGEQSSDTLRRELFEETGIVLSVEDRADAVYVQENRRHIDHIYVLRCSGNPSLRPTKRGEIADAAWYAIDDLPPLQREAHEALSRVVAERWT
jgi:ADP-ribose pyrophosphatase YjhB (NUDIX family)